MNRTIVTLAAVQLLVGCGVPKAQLDAKALEAENYRRQYGDESEKVKALQARVAELESGQKDQAKADEALTASEARVQELQKKVEMLTALNASLAQSKDTLEKARAELEKKSEQYESLASSLKDEIKAGKIELSELKGRMVVKMKDKILFSSGSVKINPEGQAALAKVAEALKDVTGKLVRVEGHTDDVPTDPKGPFPSNWELSTTRALTVLKLLQDKGVSADKLSAVGYGEHHPISTNKTTQGKSLNRRIEIVLAPEDQAPGAKPRSASR
ncbi:chemotaxis protein MotB [Corallococcus sp. H22C18031201]|uniref:OmpA/MotB family protein n=1 Tax=Citreicoccus inhibens TaxID=2849499 RepID=UPI000E71C0C2|nr:OmpA family protein [Citreicoccus inhibens]MBU8898662.1 OmpA family protein [Citreicoccus inhibens]RJS15971.1 chemotaxis protein MotB [Corallococcus sp. H22C18031201]